MTSSVTDSSKEKGRRPLIAVTHGRLKATADGGGWQGSGDPYIEALLEAGAEPWLVRLGATEDEARAAVMRTDGLLLTGGLDVSPPLYGEVKLPVCRRTDPVRDETEIAVTRAAVALDKPVLAICRGIQVLNVALGGTLFQDVATQVPGAGVHRSDERQALVHGVSLDPGSLAAGVLGAASVPVNSMHHQALKVVAPQLRAVGFADDGLIEAAEAPGRRFVLGVQWHPEELVRVTEHAARLFRAFVVTASPVAGLQ